MAMARIESRQAARTRSASLSESGACATTAKAAATGLPLASITWVSRGAQLAPLISRNSAAASSPRAAK